MLVELTFEKRLHKCLLSDKGVTRTGTPRSMPILRLVPPLKNGERNGAATPVRASRESECVCVCERERERPRERGREGEREGERDRERDRERKRERAASVSE